MHPKGSYIRNSHVPPRRVWDLYSNRVLPYHVLPHAHPGHIPGNIWTVSHSWVDEAARDLVWTPINGHEWPVPIPRETTLEHIRVELLNLGAEYVWLDVLCLRQQGRDEHEDLRKHEWRLDVPTIGHIYSDPTRCCVTYFNGLGLPFDPSPSVVLSARHWISRVWTVQEGTPAWLPGGLTGAASAAAQAFFQVNLPRAILARDQKRDMAVRSFAFALRTLRARHCSTELDRIAGLAYVLGCRTLPVYDEATSADAAWAALLMHLPPYKRTLVAVEHVVQQPDSAALFPSWAQVLDMGVGYTLRSLRPALILRLVDQASLSSDQPALYFHQVFSPGPCRITDPGSGQLRVQSLFRKTWFSLQGSTVGAISENVTYTLLSLSRTVWMIVDVLRVGELNGTPVLEVIKRGSMFLYDEPPREMTDTWVDVLYLSNDDASTTSTTASTTSSPREAGAPGVVTRLIQYAYGA
ncbi:HET-like protein [Phanerochaete sordida]|uniref:HET-like protein n=1 Tax=Phanerochaete sordida TaxID=48140 RepID=A0A9P3LAM5_9APHY|nr:HET-like protein [Phanerochaete sordida]